MSGLEQLQYLTWLVYLLVFGTVLIREIRRPTPAHLDMTLFLGAVVVVIVQNNLTSKLHLAEPTWLAADTTAAAALALGYLLLRLVRDFSAVPTWLMRAVQVGMLVSIAAILVLPAPLPPWAALLLIAYLVIVLAYDTAAFGRHAAETRGVTRRRMQAAAVGSLCLLLALVVAGLGVALPAYQPVWAELGAVVGLASATSYFVGFAPPTWLRRAWQEPEVRAFLARAASLPRLPDTRSIVGELERGTADAFGAPAASITLWDPDTRRLHGYSAAGADWELDPDARPTIARAFRAQQPVLVLDAVAADPANAEALEQLGARTVLSAPITASGKRLGVLWVYAPSAPVFANSDLELVQLLADQAAVILESRSLIDAAAQVRAREEAARLKEDFLSSAAHDLKTPLTGLVAQAQVLQRRADRDPTAPADRVGLDRVVEQSLRLRDLVLELLDVSRLEHGGLLGEREDLDLGELAQNVLERNHMSWNRRIEVDAREPVLARVDAPRFQQVLINLVENAIKFSPVGSPVQVSVWQEAGEAHLSVRDRGIGIPFDDQPLVFDRFHRARNVDDRRFAGMGLGLYISRGIVEQHGGRIWVQSMPGLGSTFHVALPALGADRALSESAQDARVHGA